MTKGRSSGKLGNILRNDNNNFLGSLLGSLTFGFFDVHKCDTEDDTWYCKFSRFFGAFIKLLFLVIIFYIGYTILFRGNRLSGGKVGIKRK